MPESIDDRLAAAGLPRLPRGVWLEIDESALAQNVGVARELVGPHIEINAVVKADGYGHGLVGAARAFQAGGVDRLSVAGLDEALVLRGAGIALPIMVLFAIPVDEVARAAQADVEIVAADVRTIAALLDRWKERSAADAARNGLVMHVEVETGLARAGLEPDDVPAIARAISDTAGVRLGSLWSHLASAEDGDATARAVEAFGRAASALRAAGLTVPPRHLAATGGLLTGRAAHYEGVRLGLCLYGVTPLDLPMPDRERAFADRLQPAMTLKCRPLRIQHFAAGTPVGYSGKWQTARESVIATLPLGYADALPRSTWPGAEALVRGHRVPLVGNVAMDAVMADVTDVPGLSMDDEFVLMGAQGDQKIDVYELARARNTIPWEALTGMSFRIPRVYHAGSVLMGLRTLNGEARVQATLLST